MYSLEYSVIEPFYRNGDLESHRRVIETKYFKTKKAAKEYVENAIRFKPKDKIKKHFTTAKDKLNYCFYNTGKTWINENTGEKEEEQYTWMIRKITVE